MLSKPKAGWLNLELKDVNTKIKFCVSYLSDPLYEMLKLLIKLYNNEIDYIPTLCFEGEGLELYLTFTDISTIATIIHEKVQAIEIYKDWTEIAVDLLKDITDDYIQDYVLDWYDEDERKENKNTLLELKKQLLQLVKGENNGK